MVLVKQSVEWSSVEVVNSICINVSLLNCINGRNNSCEIVSRKLIRVQGLEKI